MKSSAAPALVALLLLSPILARAQTAESAPEPATKPASATTTRALVDGLSEPELGEVLQLLKENFINPGALTEAEMRRAAVQGLLDRIAPGALILKAPAADGPAAASPFRAEILENRIGYARLGAITPENVSELDAALHKFTTAKLPALILDLRATPPGSEFEQTAEVCKRFSPKGRVLFSVKKPNLKQEQILTSKEDPIFRGILAVLVDGDTAGNAEVIAAVLRTHANALIIGQQTKGEAVEFAEFPLASGKMVRIAVAEVALPGNVPVFPGGVKPDLAVEISQQTTDTLLRQELEKGVGEFVFETERPRMNEAALVAGTNPELDAIQAAQMAKGEKTNPVLRDAVLQRAVDFITTVAIYERKPGAK